MSPNLAERTAALLAQPCRIRPLSAFHTEPFFRTTQIVSDRLRSSERTAAHRPSFPQNCRNVHPIPPAKPAKMRVISRYFASFGAKIRPQTPVRKKGFSATFWKSLTFQNTGQQMSLSTTFLRSVLTLVHQIPGAKTAARAVAVNCVHHKNQMNCSSDKCQRALETKNQQNIPLPKEKNTATFGDIWGLLGTYVPLSRRNDRTSVSLGKGPGRQPFQICAHAVHGTNSLTN